MWEITNMSEECSKSPASGSNPTHHWSAEEPRQVCKGTCFLGPHVSPILSKIDTRVWYGMFLSDLSSHETMVCFFFNFIF